MIDEIAELVDRPAASDYHAIEFDGRSFAVVVVLTLAFLVWFF